MKEKIIQGGIVNGVKMLVCPTWEEDFQTEIHKTGGCLRISMNYSAVDVSWWKELEKIAGKYGYTLDSESLEIIQEYVQKYKKTSQLFELLGLGSVSKNDNSPVLMWQACTCSFLLEIPIWQTGIRERTL